MWVACYPLKKQGFTESKTRKREKMKVETLKKIINENLENGKINFEAVNKIINENEFQPLLDKKVEDTKNELIKEFNVEELSKTNEELKEKLTSYDKEMLHTKKTNILLKGGIKADYLEKASKLFDVEDFENEELSSKFIEELKSDIPTFFGETKINIGGKVTPPQESTVSNDEAIIRERMGIPKE